MIRFFDKSDSAILASTTNGEEDSVDCCCFESPEKWYSWDVSIVKEEKHLSIGQEMLLQQTLSDMWKLQQTLKYLIN